MNKTQIIEEVYTKRKFPYSLKFKELWDIMAKEALSLQAKEMIEDLSLPQFGESMINYCWLCKNCGVAISPSPDEINLHIRMCHSWIDFKTRWE